MLMRPQKLPARHSSHIWHKHDAAVLLPHNWGIRERNCAVTHDVNGAYCALMGSLYVLELPYLIILSDLNLSSLLLLTYRKDTI